MALTKHKLGEFTELYNERCGNPNLTVYDISGVNADKEFFEPSKQAGADTSHYKNVLGSSGIPVGKKCRFPL